MSVEIREHVPLAPLSTLHVGGPARFFTTVRNIPELKEALTVAEDRGLPWFLLGGGSNTLFRDDGFPGLVVKMELREITVRGTDVFAGAGVVYRVAAMTAVRHALTGLEHLAGIPGTVGGAIRGNAGSFGSETCDRLAHVEILQRTTGGWKEEVRPREALDFAYRDSPFKRDPSLIVCRARFTLAASEREACERRVAADLEMRRNRQPYEFPSVGSVFQNPRSDLSAGRLVENAGCKGLIMGGAKVSEKHANFIVNVGKATAANILELIREVKRRVLETSRITLKEEIVIV